jgi:hypothetical protein
MNLFTFYSMNVNMISIVLIGLVEVEIQTLVPRHEVCAITFNYMTAWHDLLHQVHIVKLYGNQRYHSGVQLFHDFFTV